ncbi:MAG: MFS transporter [Cyanobacteria bacterium P01_A01_bin.135]
MLVKNLSRKQQVNLAALFTAGLLFWSSLASLLPTLPLYIEDAGATTQQVGTVMASFAIGLLLLKARLSKLADWRGRKLVLLIGMLASATAPLGYLMTQSLPLLIVLRAFHGISIAAFATGYSALVADMAPPKNRGELIGYMSLVNPLGLALGPALGGLLYGIGGYRPAFLLSVGLGTVGLLCVLRVWEPPRATAVASSAEAGQFWKLLGTDRLRVPVVVLLMVGIAFGAISTFVPLYIRDTGANFNVGLFYTAAAIASFSVRLLTGRASDNYGRGRFITLGLLLYGSAMVMLWQAENASMFLMGAVLQGGGAGIIIPTMAALMADRSLPEERGRIFGLCMVGFDVGLATAGPLLGSFADAIGYSGIFGLAAGLIFLGLLLFIPLSSKDVAHSIRFTLAGGRDLYAIDSPTR